MGIIERASGVGRGRRSRTLRVGSCVERENISWGEQNSEGDSITVNIKVNTSKGANILNFFQFAGARVRVLIGPQVHGGIVAFQGRSDRD